jgi:hypothetical protein
MSNIFNELQELLGTGASGGSSQGNSVSLSLDGKTLAVGGPNDSSGVGATWIFTRTGLTWTQQGSKLVGTGAVGASLQGSRVSLSDDGNTLAVGGPGDNGDQGATWIFTRTAGIWTQQGAKLVGTVAIGNARQGASVSLSSDGDTLAMGGQDDNGDQGATWIFTRTLGTWTQQGAKLVGTGAIGTARQGQSVSLSSDGDTLSVGGNRDNANQGATWIFTRTLGTWTQQGPKLVGIGAIGAARQGQSVSLSSDGDTLAVGGISDNSDAGATWVFTRTLGTWTQQGPKLVGTGAVGAAAQGRSVSLSSNGNTLAVGGPNDDSIAVGATWIFTRSGSNWMQEGLKLVGSGAIGTTFQGAGVSLSDDGNWLAVGGPSNNSEEGATWVFRRATIPCLYSRTLVKTRVGEKKISKIRKDDEVLNVRGEWVKVVSNMRFGATSQYYKIEKGSMGENVPVHTVYIRGEHPVLVGEKAVMAKTLGKRVRIQKDNVWSLCTKDSEFVNMCGLWVSTISENEKNDIKCKYDLY